MAVDLIINGDFETNPLGNVGWGLFGSIDGWVALSGSVEVQEVSGPSGNAAGDAVVELDASGNSTIQQTVTVATSGTYCLEFAYAMGGTDPATNGMQVIVDGAVVATIQPQTPGYQTQTIELDLSVGTHTIAFAGIGTSDGRGTHIDDVSLTLHDDTVGGGGDVNLVQNGGFEDTPALTRSGGIWDIFSGSQVANWTASNGIEIQAAGVAQGNTSQITELDADANTTLSQVVQIPSAGTYRLSFEYAARDGNAATNGVEVTIAGQVFTLTGLTNTSYETFSVDVTLPAGPATLSLRGLGTSDGIGTFVDNVALVAVAGGPTNAPPTAVADTAVTNEDAAVDIDVLANDTDPDGDDLTIASLAQPANGTVSVVSTGSGDVIRYVPDAGFSGTDTFTYTAADPSNETSSASVTVTVEDTTPAGTDDLIVNGGFEDNPLGNTGWGLFGSIPGWTAIVGQVEVQEGSFEAGQPAGDAIVELDASGNSTIQQTVTVIDAGLYDLTLDYAMRGTDPTTNGFQVIVDGVVVDSVNPSTPGFQPYLLTLDLSAGQHTIAFAAIGKSDGLGTYLNNVSLVGSDSADQPAIANDDAIAFDADASAPPLNVLGNDTGIGLTVTGTSAGGVGQTLNLTSTANGYGATATLAADGTFSVALGAGFANLQTGQTDTLILQYDIADNDGFLDTDTGTITVTVNGTAQGGPVGPGPELIVNGGFEDNPLNDPGAPNGGAWGFFPSIPGWTATQGLVEVHEASLAAGQPAGDAVVELAADSNSTISQTFTAQESGTHRLTLDYSRRFDDPGQSGFNVLVDGNVVGTVTPTTVGFQTLTLDILGLSAGTHTLAFESIGPNDGFGVFIDNVSLRTPGTDAQDELDLSGAGRAVVVDLEANTQADAVRVMPVGDSITRGFNPPSEAQTPGGYRALLWESVVIENGGWFDFVGDQTTNPFYDIPNNSYPLLELHDPDHRGINSITASTQAAELPGVLAANPTDVALVYIGTNDVVFDFESAAQTVADIGNVLNALEAANPNVEIFLAELTPRLNDGTPPFVGSFQATIDQINAALPQLVADAQAAGIDVTLVDTGAITTADLSDTVHLTPQGTQTLAGIWDAALANAGALTAPTTAISASIDRVVGTNFGDRLMGSSGAEEILAGGGDDWIESRDGNDTLSGGAGRDVFEFDLNDGANTITDFTAEFGPSSDILYFTGGGTVVSQQVGADAVFTYGSTTVTLENTNVFDVFYWVG